MRYRHGILNALGIAALAVALSFPIASAQNSTGLNFFDQCAAGATTCDNALNLNGTLRFDSKATNIDHAVATLNASGYSGVITTNLTSVVDCVVTLKSGSVPTITTVTALFTTGAAGIELFAWKPTSSSVTTLIPASATATVSWTCFGT